MKTFKPTFTLISLVIIFIVGYIVLSNGNDDSDLTNGDNQGNSAEVRDFKSCEEAGGIIVEEYPAYCVFEGNSYGQEVLDESTSSEMDDLIVVEYPEPNESLSSPLEITGEARGYWFFEATFPIVITDWEGLIIGEGYATATDEWMTEEFVSFTATIEFTPNTSVSNQGSIIFQKANASGLPEHDASLEYTIYFE